MTIGTFKHPQMHRNMTRANSANWQRDDHPECPSAQQLSADAAAGCPGRDSGGQQHDCPAAGLQMRHGVLNPGKLWLRPRRYAVLPAGIVRQLLVSPVTVPEGRMAEHGLHKETGEPVIAQRVANRDTQAFLFLNGVPATKVQFRQASEATVQFLPVHVDGGTFKPRDEQFACSSGGIEDLPALRVSKVRHQVGDPAGSGRDTRGFRVSVK